LEKKFGMSIKGLILQPVKQECPYIEGINSITEYILVKSLEDKDLEVLLSLGFRHFGEIFFKPACGFCQCCIPIRIPVSRFIQSKSVKRLFNRNKRLTVKLEEPTPDLEAFLLYNRHKQRFKTMETEAYETYVKSFYHPFSFNRMLTIRDGSVLVAVTHLDVTANAMSAIYCYFDERYSRYSPGKYSVYKELQFAEEMGIPWLYLGYYVPGNRHMNYKIDFKPNQLMTENNRWEDYINEAGEIINKIPLVENCYFCET